MKVLVCEDNPVSQLLLTRLLRDWDYEPILVDNGLRALELLVSEDAPELVLLDWETPGLDGYEVCRRLYETKPAVPPHIIFVTARDEADARVRGLEVGASDFVTKPFDAKELRARLLAGRRILDLRRQLREAEQRMAEAAHQDPLTGASNRRALEEHFTRECQRVVRFGGALTVALFDLDNFKLLNDAAGHAAGDDALVRFARAVRAALRATDVLGRWGGDEFLLLAPHGPAEASPTDPCPLFDRIRERLAEVKVGTGTGKAALSVSIGVTVTYGLESLTDVLERVDAALYEAKRAGRNRTQFVPGPVPSTGAKPAKSVTA